MLNSCSCREAAGVWIEGRAFLPGGGLQECSAAGAENVDESLPRLDCHRVSSVTRLLLTTFIHTTKP